MSPRIDEQTVADDRAKLAHALRELAAVKARVERDARSVHEQTRSALIQALLPVLDNFDRAIATGETQGDAPGIVAGVRMVRRQLESVLQGYGLVRFDAVGTAFDPSVHEATNMVAVSDRARDRFVVDQLEPGYRIGDRLLRAAKVVVGKYM
ncbi:MAG: nucleotide exchange factor GrpE [Kofleriaceae bacterium]